MEQDQRLTPLPNSSDLQTIPQDYPAGYPSSMYDDESFENRRSLRQYFAIIYKRLPIIIALVIIVTAAVAFYMYRQPSVYMANTKIILEPRKPKPQSSGPTVINFGGNEQNYYNTQLQLLQSPELMKDVVVALGLQRDANLFGGQSQGFLGGIRSLFSGSKQEAPKTGSSLPTIDTSSSADGTEVKAPLSPEESARASGYAGTLLGGLTVNQQERTNLVNISITSTEPIIAAKAANKLAETFIEQDAEREMMGAKKSYEELSKSIEDLKNNIANQEVELINEMRSSNLPLQEKGADLAASRLQTLSEQWLTAMDDRRKLEARYNSALQANNRGEGMNVPDLYDNTMVQNKVKSNTDSKSKKQDQIREIDKQIQEEESQKAELLVKYTPEYFKVKEKDEKIASLRASKEKAEREVQVIDRDQKKIEKEAVGGALVALRSQLDSAFKREGQLQESYLGEAARANVQGQALTKLTTLKREIETKRSLLDNYMQAQKTKELEISGSRPDNIRVSVQAETPGAPIGPQRGRNIFIAFLISLAAGIGLSFLMDYLDDSVKTSDDVGRNLGLPTLALIPHYNLTEKRKLGMIPTNGNGNGASIGSTALITLDDRKSPMAEAYRHLRTSLLFSSAGKPPQTILVTSSQPSEGKTTTAINTAITLSQADADVVIIDCDLRRPRLHSHFGLENTHGLTNYLSGEDNVDSLLKSYAGVPRLKIITSGPIPPNPAELLSSEEMKSLLRELRRKYKHVIIDSPPAISFTDAAILSTLVDGVVLVAMAGKSSVHLMRRFKQRLGTIGARIYGVVLNGIKANSIEYDYYNSGYYNYYNPSESDDSTPFMDDVVSSSTHTTKN